ncbi:hypothetical protein PFLUV_G00106080 [Perca fluviatilis]|uniref:Uncharacterized protein n=1 Tax=Perca fluviatilis TaxID=8168 RepID=A0A6A5F336_PERFL|nr:hypothetical protein PFLUV_G00106080 [Perca fluviatilis]
MSAAQSQTTLESKLEALQCHFTWDLETSEPIPLHLRDHLEDIGTEEGNSWLGHIYNLRVLFQYKLGFTEDAQSFFNKAAEAFSKIRNADEGPWLVVNYGNLAWLHHHLGDQAESQSYLSKVNALMNKYPSPSQDELHQEIYAEKAWTLMKFSKEEKRAADYFQRAIRMQPDMVEWNTSYVLGLVYTSDHRDTVLQADLLEKMRVAKEQDPKNLFLAALYYLNLRADHGEEIKDEVLLLRVKQHWSPKWRPCSATSPGIWRPASPYFYVDKDKLEDIGTEEGNSWLGHIYNLRGFVQYKLGFTEDAQSFFNKAAEAFSKIRNADEGPWLVVNYGNLAWLHHHLGDQAESQAYLSKVNALMNKYPSPSQDQLHPEIYAEKGWTLLTFSNEQKAGCRLLPESHQDAAGHGGVEHQPCPSTRVCF